MNEMLNLRIKQGLDAEAQIREDEDILNALSWAEDKTITAFYGRLCRKAEAIAEAKGETIEFGVAAVARQCRQNLLNNFAGSSTSQFANACTAAEREAQARFNRDFGEEA